VEYEKVKKDILLDLKIAQIWKDSNLVNINQLKKGDDVMVVSYAEKLKQYSTEKNAVDLLNKLPQNIPTDEIYIKEISNEKAQQNDNQTEKIDRPYTYYILRLCIALLLLFVWIGMLPFLTYQYYKLKIKRAKSISSKSYFIFKAATFLLHQFNIERQQKTYLQFAKQIVDVQYHTSFEKFMLIYLKEKFANQMLSSEEIRFVDSFYDNFENTLKKQFRLKTRIYYFLHVNRYVKYFFTIEDRDN
jgi:hypothetical protein